MNNISTLNKQLADSSESRFLRERAERVHRRALLVVEYIRIFIIEEECIADELFRLVRASVTTTLSAYFFTFC